MPLLFIFMAWLAETSLHSDRTPLLAQGLIVFTVFLFFILLISHDT